METSGLSEPLVKSRDKDDLVIVFINPFDVEGYECTAFERTFTTDEALKFFDKFFRVSREEHFIEEYIDQITNYEGEEVPEKFVMQLIVKAVLKILQEYLMLQTRAHLSVDSDEIFILIKATEENLKVGADLMDYALQLKQTWAVDRDFKEVPPYGAYEKKLGSKAKVFGIGEDTNHDDLFKKYDEDYNESDTGTLFTEVDRIRILTRMLFSVFELGKFKSSGLMIKSFPMPNKKIENELRQTWPRWINICKSQDLQKIRIYFGEKIAIYFAWIEFFNCWLIAPSIIGLILGIIFYGYGDYEHESMALSLGEISIVIFGIVLCFGTTLMDQLWARKQSVLAWKWGTSNLKETEEQRPEYKGEYMKDEISGKMKKVYETTTWFRFKNVLGYSVILLFILVVIAIIAALFLYKATLEQSETNSNSTVTFSQVVGILTACQIKVLNFIYKYVARFLTNRENHETESEYQNALTTKLFLFSFVNSYASLFYIAFAKSRYEQCSPDCFSELAIQLGTIYVTNFFLNLLEIGLPLFTAKLNIWKEKRYLEKEGLNLKISPEEKEAKQSEYEAPLDDYMEVALSYGYFVLFGIAFPFSPLICLILMLIELRVDAWKMCNLTLRPFPLRGETIGVWMGILQTIAIIGCITTPAIIIFTTDMFDFLSTTDKWIAFIVVEHLLIALKLIASSYIPDIPLKVTQGLEWGERIVNEKLFNRYVDADTERHQRNLEFVKEHSDPSVQIEEVLERKTG